MSAAGQSNVDCPNMYEDDDQRSFKRSEVDKLSRHSGVNVKGYMGSAQASEVNRLYDEEISRKQAEAMKKDPTLAASFPLYSCRCATLNGNRPAKGAIIDKELMEEEAAMLRKKQNKYGMSGMK
ncbi:hypothetical protein B0T26DRAFT_652032 [Lasiosphaeria miniovina]|uniref:Uncharacterized protein n=1 Tax=Lasiosphaeria miniovina TaxID=1954250 RepID=A0AA40A6A6_9PEZI|nr:uncharacterized protein B0T26DRAFT_652032 [Lasiosphaeria miniovina]KAK0710117.1 hypothetical protein B0T26DRAFT_652032 [Lasiosphaeria miniovina]